MGRAAQRTRIFGTRIFGTGALVLAGGLALAAAGCTSEVTSRGYIIDEAAVAQVTPGTSAEQVIRLLGTPSTTSTVGAQSYYYIQQTAGRRFQFQTNTITDQRVLVVALNKQNRVERIANYGLQDGVIFDFISRTTPAAGSERNFVQQVFQGIGKFNPLGV